MIRELILQLKLGRVSVEYFEQKFNVDIRVRFSLQWSYLEENKLGNWSGAFFVLTREALLKVDSLLQPFFLPQHQNSRYV